VVLVVLAAAADAKAVTTGRLRARMRARDFNVASVAAQIAATKASILQDITASSNDAASERNVYVGWATKLPAAAETGLGLPAGSLTDRAAASKLSAPQLENAAKFMSDGRHFLRVETRKKQAKRVCARVLVWLAQARDKAVYGNTDGPTFQYLAEKAGKAAGKPVAAGATLPVEVSLSIIFSASRTNDNVNRALNVGGAAAAGAAAPPGAGNGAQMPMDVLKPLVDIMPIQFGDDLKPPAAASCDKSDGKLITELAKQLKTQGVDAAGSYDALSNDIDDTVPKKQ